MFSIPLLFVRCIVIVINRKQLGSFGHDIIRLPSTTAPSLLLVMNGVGVLGRVIPALVSRRYGPLNLMIPLSLLSGLILFAWSGVHNQTEVIIFDVFYAFIMASGQGMFPPSLGSLTDDLSKMGVRMGMAFAACGIALLIGQPLAGVLIQAHGGGYLYAQIYSGATMTLGVVFLVAARTYRVGWRWNVIV
jgi:predicted MFS family arabinose efflux permease